MRRSRWAALSFAVTLSFAPSAEGHGFYVDDDALPGGDCQTVVTACNTISAVPDPDPDQPDVIIVLPGVYTENLVLDNPVGAVGVFASSGSRSDYVIQPAVAADPTVEINGPSQIVGFTITGEHPVVLSGPGRVLLNSFDNPPVPDGDAQVTLQGVVDGAIVERNTFVDDGAGAQAGVAIAPGASGTPRIFGNSLSGLWRGIEAMAANPRIDENVIEGPSPPGSVGIDLDSASGAALSSNVIFGRDTGVAVDSTPVTVTNLTAFDNTVNDLSLLGGASLTLNSSIVESPIGLSGVANTCSISFSAGPPPPPAPGPCDSFQVSNANPGFVNPASGDYHLASGSPLIDLGDPAAPTPTDVDVDGDLRAVAGLCGGPLVRDIGADEFQPDCPDDAPPPPPDTTPPPDGAPQTPTDVDPPTTTIRRVTVNGHTVLLRFRADEPGVSFLCKLDSKPYRPCESPTRYRRLDAGRHAFRVKAVDAARNEDPTPTVKRFRIPA